MESLPEFITYTCADCRQPIDLWDWDITESQLEAARPYVEDWSATGVLPEIDLPSSQLCPSCAIALRPPEQRERDWLRVNVHRQARDWLRYPPGTIITVEETIGDHAMRPGKGPYPGVLFMVAASWWRPEWPQATIGENVILGALVTDKWKYEGDFWRFRWSWWNPEAPESCEIVPSNAPIPRSLSDARAAFLTLRENRGRKAGTGNFANCAEFASRLDSFLADREGSGIRLTSVGMLADVWGTLGRSQMFAMFNQCEAARTRFKEHKQRPRIR